MKPELMEMLPDMALFVAVAKAKSYSHAALTLAMPVSTVSRRLAEHEARIGLQLLNRTTRKVELTDAGAAYFERCWAILEAVEAAHADLRGQLENPRGLLRVSATPDFTLTYLTPLLAEFAQRYPEIAFEFDLTPRPVDLIAEGFDVAIRMGRLPDSQLTVRKLGAARGGIYASPAYLARAGEPTSPQALAEHECVRISRPGAAAVRWTLVRADASIEVAVAGRFVTNNIRLMMQLATLGMGIAVIDAAMAQVEVALGRLVRVLPDWGPRPMPINALTPARLLPAKTRLFLDFLAEHIEGREGSVGRAKPVSSPTSP